VIGEQQSGKAQVMVAVQVRNKNMVDALKFYFVFPQLHLRAFTAVDQKKAVVAVEHLCAGIAVIGRSGCVAAQYRQFPIHADKGTSFFRALLTALIAVFSNNKKSGFL